MKYEKLSNDIWSGRIDSLEDKSSYRWHQVIKKIDFNDFQSIQFNEKDIKFCFIGFCCDAGIKINLGRIGAFKGPIAIREQMSNLPFNFNDNVKIYDIGNILCKDQKHLKDAQELLGTLVQKIKEKGIIPIVLGGGHEVAYGNFQGLKKYVKNNNINSNIGIINFDAHFDMRPYENGASSGTMFRQIADDCLNSKDIFNYMVLGIQKYGNTRNLFTEADRLNVKYILSEDIKEGEILGILNKIQNFIRNKELVHLTICSDVFSSAFAPGVSSPQPFGIDPKISLGLIKNIIRSGKIGTVDIAEVSPRFDEDNITSKLISILIFEIISTFIEVNEE